MKRNNSLKVLFTCGREQDYPRNQFIISALSQNHKVSLITDSSNRSYIRYLNILSRYPTILFKNHDISIVGFVGHPLVPFLRLFTKKPILFDPFISIYDTLVYDRQAISNKSVLARIAFWVDKFSCTLSNLILSDTNSHGDYFHQTFNVPKEKIRRLFVGCDENIFTPLPRPQSLCKHQVLYYSSYLPLHGSEVVIRAANILQKTFPSIQFLMIGEGIESKRVIKLAKDLKIKNIQFLPSVPLKQLPDFIANSTICLGGHFGSSEKARRVIAGKTFQCLAMGKATIVGDNVANRELLSHGQDAWFCDMNNPKALANSIRFLIENESHREAMAIEARNTFLAHASYKVLGKQLESIISELI